MTSHHSTAKQFSFPLSSRLSYQRYVLLFLFISFLPIHAFAKSEEVSSIAKILSQKNTPDGVVFELIGSEDSDYLEDSLKKVEDYKKQLQAKYPGLDIAVVSHGAEQFALTKDRASTRKESHQSVKRLVAADVPVHICETHASWRGVTAEDFPDYITPSPTGPAQIKMYQELGYVLVVIH